MSEPDAGNAVVPVLPVREPAPPASRSLEEERETFLAEHEENVRLHTELTALTTRLADNGYDKDSELSGYRSALEEIARYPSGTYGSAEIARVALSANGHDCIYNNDAMRYNQSMINTVETKPNIVAVAASLLDALKVLRRDHSMAQPHHEDLCSICKQADAAIAKAESGV